MFRHPQETIQDTTSPITTQPREGHCQCLQDLHNILLEWDGLSDLGRDDADWIYAKIQDLIRKRREELRARNPNRRGPPSNSYHTVSYITPFLVIGTADVD